MEPRSSAGRRWTWGVLCGKGSGSGSDWEEGIEGGGDEVEAIFLDGSDGGARLELRIWIRGK